MAAEVRSNGTRRMNLTCSITGARMVKAALQTERSLSGQKSPSMNWCRHGKMRKTRRSASTRYSRSTTAGTKLTSRPRAPLRFCLTTFKNLICRGNCPQPSSGRKSCSALKAIPKDSRWRIEASLAGAHGTSRASTLTRLVKYTRTSVTWQTCPMKNKFTGNPSTNGRRVRYQSAHTKPIFWANGTLRMTR